MNSVCRSLLAILIALMCTTRGFAQTTISGRVLDAQGKPVAGIQVLLHAITESAGSQIDTDTSRVDGGFDLHAGTVDAKAVYFVAVTHNGELFMGDLLRPPFPAGQEYIVRVGVNPVDFSGATAAPEPTVRPAGNTRAGAAVILIAALVIGGVFFVGLRRRPPEQRRLLVELARLEEDLGTASANGVLQKRRQELRERLMATKQN